MYKKFSFLLLVLAVITLSGCGGSKPVDTPYTVKLEVWGTIDDSDAYSDAISQYLSMNHHVSDISYKKMPAETYKDDLLRAFAEGRGPDLFFIRNAWLPDFASLIVPVSDYQTNEGEYKTVFTDAVTHDFVDGGKIYGAPLTTDSIALYYNKDLFNAAGIAQPPTKWDELVKMLPQFNQVDTFGTVIRSGIAMGTAANINRSTDLFLALAMQAGAKVDPGERPLQDKLNLYDEPAQKALSFYSQFAKVSSPYYSWNPRLHYSTDAFSEGTLAMMINYSWKVAELQRKNAKLNFGVAPLPQSVAGSPANLSNYWGLVVAKNKILTVAAGEKATMPRDKYNDLRVHESWEFLYYLAFPHEGGTMTIRNPLTKFASAAKIKDDATKTYLVKTSQPAARRDLIELQKNDPYLGPFVYGNLIAKSWRSGNPEQVEPVIAQAISDVNLGKREPGEALATVSSVIANIVAK